MGHEVKSKIELRLWGNTALLNMDAANDHDSQEKGHCHMQQCAFALMMAEKLKLDVAEKLNLDVVDKMTDLGVVMMSV